MIRNYTPQDEKSLLNLWNSRGIQLGYAPQDAEGFQGLITRHRDFSPEHTFLVEEDGKVQGFITGCTGAHIHLGNQRGYITCLLLAEEADSDENTQALLCALEDSFREKGRTQVTMSFFNPMRLPWVIPGTPGHQHNNLPGVPADLPLFSRMKARGYQEDAQEIAMYLDLAKFRCPGWVEEKAQRMAAEGCTVARFDPDRHWGLKEMVDSLNNSMWSEEIPQAAADGLNLLVALKDDQVAGFTGPVYPEPTGRGYFAGIGVAPQFEKRGFGTLLFYRLLQAELEAGSAYMSLFTGRENRARFIYEGAGFEVRREFSVMTKQL